MSVGRQDQQSPASVVRELMPQLKADLARLVAVPCISAPGFPEATRPALMEAYEMVVGLFRDAGVETLGSLELPDTAPIITGEIPAPPGAPDRPAVLALRRGAGRGRVEVGVAAVRGERARRRHLRPRSADSKSNILMHVGALRAWKGKPPVGIKIVIEGQEETGSAFSTYPPSEPQLFASDAMVIGDMGSVRPGAPTLTIALRGMATVIVEVRTLAGPKHSGQFGGAAPDALITLLHALSALHDEHGDVAVPGLRREEWAGASYSDEEFRELAEILPGMPFFGTGGLGERIWSGPALTVTGIDVQPVDQALNAVVPYARAKLSLRIHPEQDPEEAQAILVRHLESMRPFGIPLQVTATETGTGFAAKTTGPAYEAARRRARDGLGQRPALDRDGRLDPARERAPGSRSGG